MFFHDGVLGQFLHGQQLEDLEAITCRMLFVLRLLCSLRVRIHNERFPMTRLVLDFAIAGRVGIIQDGGCEDNIQVNISFALILFHV